MDKKKIGIALLALPMFVNASVNYNEAKSKVSEFLSSLEDYKKYILIDNELQNGDFLTNDEFRATINGKSYLAIGPQFWLKDSKDANKKYIVDYTLKDGTSVGTSGIRITEFVKSDSKVSGTGSQATPWVFVDQYTVRVKSSNETYGTINKDSKVIIVEANTGNECNPSIESDYIHLNIVPKAGYGYAGNSINGKKSADSIKVADQGITSVDICKYDITNENDIIVYFLPRVDMTYKINHKYEKLASGEYDIEMEEKTGTTGAQTTATAKTREGFTPQTVTQAKINGSGDTTVDIKYTRNSYSLSINNGTGISSVSGAATYKFGQQVTLDATLLSGYKFKEWKENGVQKSTNKKYIFNMPAGNKTYDAVGEPEEVDYTINHYYETITDDNFATAEKEVKRGKTGAQTEAVASTRAGFTARNITQGTISGDGKTVVDIKYDRNEYDVKLIAGTGIKSVTGESKYKYDQEITINAVVQDGYTWSGWTGLITLSSKESKFKVPINGITLTANATKNSSSQSTGGGGGGGSSYSGGGGSSSSGGSSNKFEYKDSHGNVIATSDTYEGLQSWAEQNPYKIVDGSISQNGYTVSTIDVYGGTAHVTPKPGTNIVEKNVCASGCC